MTALKAKLTTDTWRIWWDFLCQYNGNLPLDFEFVFLTGIFPFQIHFQRCPYSPLHINCMTKVYQFINNCQFLISNNEILLKYTCLNKEIYHTSFLIWLPFQPNFSNLILPSRRGQFYLQWGLHKDIHLNRMRSFTPIGSETF